MPPYLQRRPPSPLQTPSLPLTVVTLLRGWWEAKTFPQETLYAIREKLAATMKQKRPDKDVCPVCSNPEGTLVHSARHTTHP